ncbi:MAG: hypothetical protein JNM60_06655 [Candidatus Competibacteraceae bacterium]|nr:hypothetical protein [Candidatus Competibacteraceae bacterium]
MLAYKTIYQFVDGGIHAEVLDFPVALTRAETLPEARQLLASALVEMAASRLRVTPGEAVAA